MDGSGLSLYYTPNLRTHDAGVFWTGDTNIVIPPGRSRTVLESMCPARCTNKIFKDTIYLISGLNHMHYKGKLLHIIQTRVVRSSKALTFSV